MPELQTAISAFNARIAEYVAGMSADEAEAFRQADREQARTDAIPEAGHVSPSAA